MRRNYQRYQENTESRQLIGDGFRLIAGTVVLGAVVGAFLTAKCERDVPETEDRTQITTQYQPDSTNQKVYN